MDKLAPEISPDGKAPWHVQPRRDAAQNGQSKYYTGHLCKRGHISRRYTSSGLCVSCMSLRSRRFREDKAAANNGLVPLNAMVHPDDLKTLEAIISNMSTAREAAA